MTESRKTAGTEEEKKRNPFSSSGTPSAPLPSRNGDSDVYAISGDLKQKDQAKYHPQQRSRQTAESLQEEKKNSSQQRTQDSKNFGTLEDFIEEYFIRLQICISAQEKFLFALDKFSLLIEIPNLGELFFHFTEIAEKVKKSEDMQGTVRVRFEQREFPLQLLLQNHTVSTIKKLKEIHADLRSKINSHEDLWSAKLTSDNQFIPDHKLISFLKIIAHTSHQLTLLLKFIENFTESREVFALEKIIKEDILQLEIMFAKLNEIYQKRVPPPLVSLKSLNQKSPPSSLTTPEKKPALPDVGQQTTSLMQQIIITYKIIIDKIGPSYLTGNLTTKVLTIETIKHELMLLLDEIAKITEQEDPRVIKYRGEIAVRLSSLERTMQEFMEQDPRLVETILKSFHDPQNSAPLISPRTEELKENKKSKNNTVPLLNLDKESLNKSINNTFENYLKLWENLIEKSRVFLDELQLGSNSSGISLYQLFAEHKQLKPIIDMFAENLAPPALQEYNNKLEKLYDEWRGYQKSITELILDKIISERVRTENEFLSALDLEQILMRISSAQEKSLKLLNEFIYNLPESKDRSDLIKIVKDYLEYLAAEKERFGLLEQLTSDPVPQSTGINVVTAPSLPKEGSSSKGGDAVSISALIKQGGLLKDRKVNPQTPVPTAAAPSTTSQGPANI